MTGVTAAGCSTPPTETSTDSVSVSLESTSSSNQNEENGVIVLRTVSDLKKIPNNPNGHYELATDIDCMGSSLELGNFDGILDGKGHSICNVKNEGNYRGLFMRLGKNSVLKNIGFYNMETTLSSLNQYHFALALWLEGTVENVSFHQGGIGTICSVFNILEEGCQISNFVAYTKNVQSSGFFNSGKRSYIQNPSDIYIFSNKGWSAPIEAATAYFETGTSGTDYTKTEAYKALNFKSIFDCSATGVWTMDFNLKIPLIKHAMVSVM